jgi:Rieske Fe-S protein
MPYFYPVKCKYVKQFIFIGIVVLLCLISCRKDENPVPVTSLTYKVLAIEGDARYSNLRTAGGSAILQTGNLCAGHNCNGVVVYRVKVSGECDDFRAFDRTCTFEASGSAMEIDESWPYILRCPTCGSEFNMEGGYMEKGPAKYPLREFDCDFYDGDLSFRTVSK